MNITVRSAACQLLCALLAAGVSLTLPPVPGNLLFVAYLMAYSYWAGYREASRRRPDPSPESLAPAADQALGRLATRLPDADPTYDYADTRPISPSR